MRDTTLAYLSLGSNVDRERNLPEAARRLRRRVRLVSLSQIYDTEAVGGAGRRPPFFNAAAAIETSGSPESLKRDVLVPIEEALGRQRTADPDAPRTIDLDLVWWDGPGGAPPDPDVARYRHLAEPLAEIAPDLLFPGTGERLRDLAARLARDRPEPSLEPRRLPAWEAILRSLERGP